MRRFEGLDLGFLLFQFRPGLRELSVKESRCTFGKLLLRFKIFVNENGRKLAVHLLSELGRTRRITDLKGRKFSAVTSCFVVRACHVDSDVFPHLFSRTSGLQKTAHTVCRGIE